ncbi:putative ferric-chelate reductase 1 [Salarias fasciatus]|uniref:putative ferric-chelate reductase 1 n=1 Tax=Salarias fasciatus TaxID=181472 RepID=UPI0011767D28|nr:putative ferric-chelate reductase 1 [Salarias fasciatus]
MAPAPVLLLLCFLPLSESFSSGLVLDSCEDMTPRHSGLRPQTDTSPFTVSFRVGRDITVLLQAPASTPFVGFLLQARAVGSGSPVGSFGMGSESAQLLSCRNRPNISSADCGLVKVCLSEPPGCDPALTASCHFLSAMALPGGPAVRYELTGPSEGYVSLGLSNDQIMGNDDIYICVLGAEGLVEVRRAFSVGRTAPRMLPLGNVSDVKASERDGVLSCSFTSMNLISTQRSSGLNTSYYLMFAHGPSQNGHIQFHRNTFISSSRVDISQPAPVQTAGWPHIIRAHGALMLTAWMGSGSVGMMVARYLRGAGSEHRLCGKQLWFMIHVMLMSVTVAATVVAFVLPFSHVKAWSGGAHPVLGCLLLTFSCLQPLLALLRPGPHHPRRFLFSWSHALMAGLVKVLSVASIFTGLQVMDGSVQRWLLKVMGGFVAWEVLFFLLLELQALWIRARLDVVLVSLFCGGNLPFLLALLVGIGRS